MPDPHRVRRPLPTPARHSGCGSVTRCQCAHAQTASLYLPAYPAYCTKDRTHAARSVTAKPAPHPCTSSHKYTPAMTALPASIHFVASLPGTALCPPLPSKPYSKFVNACLACARTSSPRPSSANGCLHDARSHSHRLDSSDSAPLTRGADPSARSPSLALCLRRVAC